jgi:antitoxin component YwqK of YwqJK toxin-antitoxin module
MQDIEVKIAYLQKTRNNTILKQRIIYNERWGKFGVERHYYNDLMYLMETYQNHSLQKTSYRMNAYNGTPLELKQYRNNNFQGLILYKHFTEHLKEISYFNNGKMHAVCHRWYPNGNPKVKFNNKNGYVYGHQYRWEPNGACSKTYYDYVFKRDSLAYYLRT